MKDATPAEASVIPVHNREATRKRDVGVRRADSSDPATVAMPCTQRSRVGPGIAAFSGRRSVRGQDDQRHRPALRRNQVLTSTVSTWPPFAGVSGDRGNERRLLQPHKGGQLSDRHKDGPRYFAETMLDDAGSQFSEDDRCCRRAAENLGTWPHRAKNLDPPTTCPPPAAVTIMLTTSTGDNPVT